MTNSQRASFVSVILPVADGAATVERAVRSVLVQAFADWELLAVDDASTDGTHDALEALAAGDERLRVVRLETRVGLAAACNAALRLAHGRFIAYLDACDELAADYLTQIERHAGKGDVLVFACDIVAADGQVSAWDPAEVRGQLFAADIAPPLCVAHRRPPAEKLGGFNESLWQGEHAELWRRLARAGLDFAFLPLKSGRRHLPPAGQQQPPLPTPRQRETAVANWRAGRPLFDNGQQPARRVRKIAFVSPHCAIDFTSGAAIATLQCLQFLQTLGFQCQAFCGLRSDAGEEVLLQQVMAQQGAQYEVRKSQIGPYRGRMMFAQQGGVPITLFENASTSGAWRDAEEVQAFLAACELFLTKNRPDAVLTYGGDPVAELVMRLVKRLDIPIVFGLHNFGYPNPETFAATDYVVVPSEFSRQHHWQKLGLACQRLPYVIDWRRVQVAEREPRYVTFVNPELNKGVTVFARIAEVLLRRRPEIPLLVVEGRNRANHLRHLGVDFGTLPNVTLMENTPDPRRFYAVTKLLLVPSLWNESFGLVVAEGMINGIPVLASNRGALPETVGDAGFLFDIPAAYTPQSTTPPTAEEVEPWVETIVRLWDDPEAYQQASDAARQYADRWRPENLAPLYRDFFGSLFPQPGPPLVPKDIVNLSDGANANEVPGNERNRR